jgi:hypothetical protein
MAAYYYTTTDETPEVYHTDQGCSEGLKIEKDNREGTNTIPANRQPCSVCK